MFPSPLITSWLWALASCAVKQKVSTVASASGPSIQLSLLHGPVIFYQPGKGVTAHLLDTPFCLWCLLPRPVLMFRVLALTHPQSLPSWERLQGDSRQPLITAFMNSAPSILKRRKLEAQNCKLFGKRGILPWALAMQAT